MTSSSNGKTSGPKIINLIPENAGSNPDNVTNYGINRA